MSGGVSMRVSMLKTVSLCLSTGAQSYAGGEGSGAARVLGWRLLLPSLGVVAVDAHMCLFWSEEHRHQHGNVNA